MKIESVEMDDATASTYVDKIKEPSLIVRHRV